MGVSIVCVNGALDCGHSGFETQNLSGGIHLGAT